MAAESAPTQWINAVPDRPLEREMATLRAALVLLLAVFLCSVDAQFSVTIDCPDSGKCLVHIECVLGLYRY